MNSACRSCALAAASSSALGLSRRKITLISTSIWAIPARSSAPTALRYSVSIRAWERTKLIRQIALMVTWTESKSANALLVSCWPQPTSARRHRTARSSAISCSTPLQPGDLPHQLSHDLVQVLFVLNEASQPHGTQGLRLAREVVLWSVTLQRLQMHDRALRMIAAGHSKVRISKPGVWGSMRGSIMVAPHLGTQWTGGLTKVFARSLLQAGAQRALSRRRPSGRRSPLRYHEREIARMRGVEQCGRRWRAGISVDNTES
jgi:hypothetical protein